jgi:hypothetical protein
MGFLDFFKPKWKHSEWRVRKEAIKKISKQRILKKIAKNDVNVKVRVAAIEKITDQDILIDIVKTDLDLLARLAATVKISDKQRIRDCDTYNMVSDNSYRPWSSDLMDFDDISFRSRGGSASSSI